MTPTEELVQIYKEETGITEVNVFDFEYWLFEREMAE